MLPNHPVPGAPSDNSTRSIAGRPGIESYFLRANHPTEPRAVWLKATILVPTSGPAVAEAWIAVFAPEGNHAVKATVPLEQATFAEEGGTTTIRVGACEFRLGPTGGAVQGTLGGHRWDLRYDGVAGLGGPLCVYPSRRMIDGGFPTSKLLTPVPVARFSGTVDRTSVVGWLGMQGHNWGKVYAVEYAWGQCLFPGEDGAPFAMVEGFTGRVRIGPVVTPRLSALIVRRGENEYRFDQVFSPWRQRAEVGDRRWSLGVSGPAGEARLTLEADTAAIVCLGYVNPDGALSYCLNSKLARVRLRVNPTNEEGFECASAHGGALEFLRRTPDPSFPQAV